MAAGSTRAATATTPSPAAVLVRAVPAATARVDRRTARASPAASSRTASSARSVAPHCSSSRSPCASSSTRVPSIARRVTTRGSAAAVPRRASTNASAPAPATSSTTAPATGATRAVSRAAPTPTRAAVTSGWRTRRRVVEQGVDVVDDTGEQVAAARAEAPGDQRDEGGEDLGPALREHAEDDVVASTPLGVAEHRAGEAEECAPRRSPPSGRAPAAARWRG